VLQRRDLTCDHCGGGGDWPSKKAGLRVDCLGTYNMEVTGNCLLPSAHALWKYQELLCSLWSENDTLRFIFLPISTVQREAVGGHKMDNDFSIRSMD
jgi:hypothetical protein